MIIYEVNLAIDRGISVDFNRWLKEHVIEMLKFSGFTRAEICKEEDTKAPCERLSVRYRIKQRQHLEDYLQNHAQRMQDQSIKRFKGRFSATRRILSPLHTSVEK